MDYALFHTDDVPVTGLGETAFPSDSDIRQIDAALDTEDVRIKLWYFGPGESMADHAHIQQEEIYHVLEGEFVVTLGEGEDDEEREVGPGTWWRASPQVAHGHRYVGDDRGVLLAIGAPGVDDEPASPDELED